MNSNAALLLIVPLLCAMRDPFAPVADPCQSAQLSLWHYRGVVQSGGRLIGIVQSEAGKWQRVGQNEVFNGGWHVIEIAPERLLLDTGTGCEPQRWQWKREGTPNDKKDRFTDTASGAATEPGEERHPGGG